MPREIVVKDVEQAQDLAWWRKQKQVNEQEMAKSLAGLFNSGVVIQHLRGATRAAMPYICDASRSAIFQKIWAKERSGYRVFLEKGDWPHIRDSVDSLSAEHCSNIIRLYCAIVEEENQGDAQKMAGLRRDFGRFDPTGTGQKATGDDAKVIWKGGRQRESGQTANGQKRPLTFEETQPLRKGLYDFTDAGLLGRMVKGQSGQVLRIGGMATNVMKNDSTVLKLDRVFGLAAGADISGTTTDTLHFMDQFALNIDPIFALLPVATIVPECHHTLLEVALSLTLNKLVGAKTGVDYSVGLYTTLMPKGRSFDADFNDARRLCIDILKDYEERKANRLMMTYYTSPGVAGGTFLFDKRGDRELWSLMCSADDNLLQSFRRASAWPTRDEVAARISVYQ